MPFSYVKCHMWKLNSKLFSNIQSQEKTFLQKSAGCCAPARKRSWGAGHGLGRGGGSAERGGGGSSRELGAAWGRSLTARWDRRWPEVFH